jgi:hypothetical protein
MSDPEKYRKMSYIECVAREGSNIMIAAGIAPVQMYNVTFHTYLRKVVFEFENKHKMKHVIITSRRDGNFHMEPHRKERNPLRAIIGLSTSTQKSGDLSPVGQFDTQPKG